MRIAHVAPVIYPVPPATYGGTERVVADLACAQHALGHDVTVFASIDSKLPDIELIGRYLSVAGYREVSVETLPPGFPAELEAEQVSDLVKHAGDFDVVHLHGTAHASGVCAAIGVPTFRTIHWRADEADHARHFECFAKERVIAISERQARDVPRPSLAGVVHHGLPTDRYQLLDEDQNRLVFIGRMTDQKRPDRAIELAAACAMSLKLAGPVDPGNPTYFDREVAPRFGAGIVHVGTVTDAQKQDFLAGATALVFPIDWPEPFGLVMIEAMACGVPVIAWDRGSVREIVEDGVTGIVVSSVQEAVSRMDEVRRLNRLSIRRRFEERFSIDRAAKQVIALYETAVAHRSSSDSSASFPSPYR